MTRITVSDVESYWPVVPLQPLEPTIRGTNNRSFLVTAREGFYILRWYQNVDVTDRLRFEQELLRVLADVNLPFEVPSFLPTRHGKKIRKLHRDGKTLHLALFPRIPGQAPMYGNRAETFQCGGALAALDLTLENIVLDPEVPIQKVFGDLSLTHPFIPQPIPTIIRVLGAGMTGAAVTKSFQRLRSVGSAARVAGIPRSSMGISILRMC